MKSTTWPDSLAGPALIAVAQPDTLWAPASSRTVWLTPLLKLGASLTGVPVTGLEPLTDRAPSDTLVVIEKPALTLAAGTKLTPARRALTLAIAPDAVHTPVPGT